MPKNDQPSRDFAEMAVCKRQSSEIMEQGIEVVIRSKLDEASSPFPDISLKRDTKPKQNRPTR